MNNLNKLFFLVLLSVIVLPVLVTAENSFTTPTNPTNSKPALNKVITWVPYWKKDEAVASALQRLDYFTEFSPFAFSVRSTGALVDTMKINQSPWPQLIATAKARGIKITPSIMMGDKKLAHKILSNRYRRTKHINSIVATVIRGRYDGIDIDYEGKSGETKPYFSAFIQELSRKLHLQNKILSCTIEARTGDRPEIKEDRVFGGPWADDYVVLGKYCDQVRLMAYDQAFPYELPELAKYQPADPTVPYTPVADNKWVEDVIKYTMQTIPKEKIVLGVPTYGREFEVVGKAGNWRYGRVKSVTYESALNLASVVSGVSAPKRSVWGEMIREYWTGGSRRQVVYQDRQSINDKIEIAKKYGIAGVAIFKIDGTEGDLLY